MQIPFKVENHPEGMNQVLLFLMDEEREIAERLLAEGVTFTIRFSNSKKTLMLSSIDRTTTKPIRANVVSNTEDGLHEGLKILMRKTKEVLNTALECN